MNHPPALRYEPLYVIQGFLNNFKVPGFQTSENINFQGCEIGKLYPHFFKEVGDPYYLTISENDKDPVKFVVAGYKQQIYKYEAVMLYFFWDNMLFAGQYQIRREKQKVEPVDLAAKLMAKYKIADEKLDGNNFKIKESGGNEVFFEDTGFTVEISIYNPKLIKQLKVPKSISIEQNEIIMDKASVTF